MRHTRGLLSVGLVLMVGCFSQEEPSQVKEKQPLANSVRVETVGRQAVTDTLETVGTVQSRKQSIVSARVVAPVVAIPVNEGERVQAGQVVIELDDRDVKAQQRRTQAGLREAHNALAEVEHAILAAEKALEAAQAQHEFAQATLKRYEALLERRSVAPQEYDEVAARRKTAGAEVERAQAFKASLAAKKRQAVNKIGQAEAELANAAVLVGYTKISAPFAGTVVAIPTQVGNLATPGVPLFRIEEERYLLETTLEESQITRAKVG